MLVWAEFVAERGMRYFYKPPVGEVEAVDKHLEIVSNANCQYSRNIYHFVTRSPAMEVEVVSVDRESVTGGLITTTTGVLARNAEKRFPRCPKHLPRCKTAAT
jgi:hypothetical protein